MTFGSLFAGIGGIDLGLERAGLRCLFQVEINPFCQKILARHWPAIEKHGDIRDLRAEDIPYVDLIAGGFPCQDISAAGKRAGITGARSGLWREMVRTVRMVRPRYVLVENVADLLVRGMGAVLGDLADGGYDAEWDCLSACQFGAPHPRERVFVVAYPAGERGIERRGLEQYTLGEAERNVCFWAREPEPVRVADGIPAELDFIGGLTDEQGDSPKGLTEAHAVIWSLLRAMWEHREIAATSPELYAERLCGSVPEMSRYHPRSRWYMGTWRKETEDVRRLWKEFYSESFAEAQDVQRRLLEYLGQAKRKQAMAFNSDRMDRKFALGNSVSPIVSEYIARQIIEATK